MDLQPERLTYNRHKLVDRADEVQLVVDKARNLSAGFPGGVLDGHLPRHARLRQDLAGA